MTRKVVFLIVLSGLIWWWLQKDPQSDLNESPAPSIVTNTQGTEVTTTQGTYVVYVQKINPNNVTLIPNFTEKKSSKTLTLENECDYGINGGFYTADDKPLGLFHGGTIDQRTVHTESLFNGFLYKANGGDFGITSEDFNFRDTSMEFMFQSGPLVSPQTNLQIRSDEQARRMVVARAGTTYYFIGITEEENTNNGPYLEELPDVLASLNLSIDQALNLDGGAASAFKSENGVHLGEVLPIGSFLCGKN